MTPEEAWSSIRQVKSVSRETFERLTVYHDLLIQWQARINLISPATLDQIWQRHIADSLQICAAVPDVKSVVDIGSGAGFPGLVHAILMAEAGDGTVDLIESNGKKCAFMNAVIRDCELRRLGITAKVHHGRIEDVLPTLSAPKVVTARALASLDDLLGLTECYLTKGTTGVFAKGRDHQAEISTAQDNWDFQYEKKDSILQNGSVILKISRLKRR